MFGKKNVIELVCVAALALTAQVAQANLVSNGDFSSGSTNWSLSTNAVIDSGTTHSPSNSLRFNGSDAAAATASQTVALVAGNDYELSFFLTGNRRALSISFGGANIDFSANCSDCEIREPDPMGDPFDSTGIWYQYFARIEHLANDLLEFSFSAASTAGSVNLDDVSVICAEANGCTPGNNQTPEPGSLLLVGAALAGLGVARRRFTRA